MSHPLKAGRIICTALTLSLAAFCAEAQPAPANSFSFSQGDVYKLPKKHQDLGFVGNAADGYVQIGHRYNRSLSLQKFDPELHLVSEKEVDLGNLPKGYMSEQFVHISNQYYWFFSTWDRTARKERLFAQEYDISNNEMKGEAREILSADKITGTLVATGFYQFNVGNKWHFYPSFDSSRILIEYRRKPEVRNDSRSKDLIGFFVFDNHLNQIWGQEVQMPYTEEKMDNEGYRVDRQGNVYTLAKVYEGSGNHNKNTSYHYEVLKWAAGDDKATAIPFRLGNKYVNTAIITEDPQGTVMVGGYYSARKNSASADGFFLLKIDESNELVNVRKGMYEFPVAVLKAFESRRTQHQLEKKREKGKTVEAPNMSLHKLIIRSDGSVTAFGEESYAVTHTYYSGKSVHQVTYYYYQDILAVQISPEGTLEWIKKVPKNQMGRNSGLGDMSFYEFSKADQHYLFFLDNARNMDIRPDETPAQHIDREGGILTAVELDSKGGTHKTPVFDTRKEHKRITVTEFSPVGNDRIIARLRGKKHKSLPALLIF